MGNLYPAERIAQGALAIGVIVAAGAGAVAVAHFAFGIEVYGRNGGEPSPPRSLAVGLLFLGMVGAVLASLGALTLRAGRRRNGS